MKHRLKISLALSIAVFLSFFTLTALGLPNLTPYQPAGWSDKIVVARTTNTVTDSASLTTSDTLYVDWAIINNGASAVTNTFYNYLYVDGLYLGYWTTDSLGVDSTVEVTNFYLGFLTAGTHTIEITADATGTVAESNESDNSYTKTITVSSNSTSLPNLTPYQLPGWTDRIVISRTANSITDSTSLTTADTLYLDWGVINDGNAPAVGTFYTYLYLDTVYQGSWSTASLGIDDTVDATNYYLGPLAAGTHTIEITTDATGVIAESNEADNSYTKTISISNSFLPNLTPYQPPGWSAPAVVSRTANTTTDSTSLTTADSLYLDWAVINSGNATAAGTFYVYLYVDGAYQAGWSVASLNTNTYVGVTNYLLGTLSAGTHAIEITADATGVIAESNEADNSYTKTVTVSLTNLPAPTLSSPANGSVGQSADPAFSWSAATGATSYRIIVATNPADLPTDPTATNGGSSVVINATNSTPNYTPSTPLAAGTTCYWEVCARNATQFGEWSVVNSFTVLESTGGALTIIPIFDTTITSDPQAAIIEATINSAIAVYQSDFSDRITVSIKFQEVSTGIDLCSKYSDTFLYSDYVAALLSHSTSTDDSTALAHLPNGTTNPVNSNLNINLNLPLARALGFSANPPAGQPDGTISLCTSVMNLSAAQTNASYYSLFAVVSHEIDEVLGLGSALDNLTNGASSPTGAVCPEDLFRYNLSGARSFTTAVNAAAYFSLDGTTDLGQFNQYQGGYFGDWYSYYGGQTPEVQDAYSTPGAAPVLGMELRLLDIIGFTRILSSSKSSQTITFVPLANRAYGEPSFALSATVSSALLASFTILSGPAFISGNSLTLTGTGSVVVQASQSGNTYYNAASNVVQTFTVSAPPQLTLTKSAGNLAFSWPTNVGGFVLQNATSLSTVISWSNISSFPVIVNNRYTVTNTAASGNMFYRLKK
jgi:hypothetical protein